MPHPRTLAAAAALVGALGNVACDHGHKLVAPEGGAGDASAGEVRDARDGDPARLRTGEDVGPPSDDVPAAATLDAAADRSGPPDVSAAETLDVRRDAEPDASIDVSVERSPPASPCPQRPAPAGQACLDQEIDGPAVGGIDINEGSRHVAQTYTAGITGVLYAVAIEVKGLGTHQLRVAVRDVANGIPTASVLGETLLPSNQSPFPTLITFPTAIEQIAGRQYAVVVDYPQAPSSGAGRVEGSWSIVAGARYPGGASMSLQESGAWRTWEFDALLRTYVKPGP
jgi:hypothetical protein